MESVMDVALGASNGIGRKLGWRREIGQASERTVERLEVTATDQLDISLDKIVAQHNYNFEDRKA